MDGNAAFDKNLQALKRFLAMLIAMAEMGIGGLGTGGQFTLFPQKGAAASRLVRAEKGKLSPAPTLPRHLHRAILKLLQPAESAVRRLIVVAARGLVVTLSPPRKSPESALHRGPRAFIPVGPGRSKRAAGIPLLPLLDPPWRWNSSQPWQPAPTSIPHITSLDDFARFQPLPAPPSRDDPVNAVRLTQRLQALAAALDDMPGQAKRFARWKARVADAAATQNKKHDAAAAQVKNPDAASMQHRQSSTHGTKRFRSRRLSPLRPGRPPGGRLSRYDPLATHGRNIREIDEILAHAHALAVYALETPDTS